MGWLFSERWRTREELRTHLTKERILKSCWTGNNLWMVGEYTYPADHAERAGKTIRYVGLCLCSKHGKGLDGWGYKDMDESAGPYHLNCPLSYIERVEAHEKEHGYEPVGYAKEWRAKVREQHAKNSRKLTLGQHIKVYDKEYVVSGLLGRRGYLIDNGSMNYRLSLTKIKHVEVLP